jgi:phospho-N-acetylmuramoyl-pentapeptide-transferase
VLLLPGGTRGECDLTLFALLPAIAGACIAFLWFNANPAKVFMGDTGSMAIGVALPAIAILTHREVLMIVVGLVFVLDGLSSAVQWAVFKYTRITTGTGRRVFKKSPIHHHFELSGWPEQTVVVRFWIMGAVAALIGFAGAVWRIW